jgi:tRNA pseudouridine55 synthase
VKRLFDAQKVGHAGTLDPLASGALPIALGEATKTVPFVQDGAKLYRFTIRWGVDTDSDDADGKVTATSDLRPTREAIEAAARSPEIMHGPAFSATRSAASAPMTCPRRREGRAAERPVSIHRLALVEMPDADHAVLEAECGKGTYVRSSVATSHRLGTCGHARRSAGSVGPFDATNMIPIAALITAEEDPPGPRPPLMPIGMALTALPEVVIQRTDRRDYARPAGSAPRGGHPGRRRSGPRHLWRAEPRYRRD